MESPECPVCLQNYDGYIIPRVLACGHSICEACLVKLPQRYAHTVRCPACTQLVKFPPQGPSGLPKNIDLLSFSRPKNQNSDDSCDSQKPRKASADDFGYDFLPRFWSEEFYAAWKDWVLPKDSILVETNVEDEGRGDFFSVVDGKTGPAVSSSLSTRVCFGEDQRVSLVRVVSFPRLDDSEFELSYVARVMKCLSGMREELRNELSLILRASVRLYRSIGTVYGLWGNLVEGFLYIVCERRPSGNFLEKLGDLSNGCEAGNGNVLSKHGVSAFAMIGMEMCEAVIGLHSQGFIAGCITFSCFNFDDFGHAYLDLNAILVRGREIRRSILDATSGRLRIHDEELGVIIGSLLKDDGFVSPELLLELLHKEGIVVECDKSRYSIGYSSDIWALACLLLRLLLRKAFAENVPKMIGQDCSDYSTMYSSWLDKVNSVLETELGSEYALLRDILLKCLIYDPGSRPLMTDLRKCIRELIIKPPFDALPSLDGAVDGDSTSCCIILGELCQLPKEISPKWKEDDLQGREAGGQSEESADTNFIEDLSRGSVKFKDLQGHRDCITGLAVGGGFLFSSSYDKTIRVWSLQDFSHIQTFEGHEHRVMALIYVDQEQPLCISGDSGGGIFVWGTSIPLGQEPIKKWYEQKDWRYSGIHALSSSGNGYVYTGSGDKSIKAWLLQDGTLSCTMNGHKSVVSTLAVCNEILYSGSWDGTVRLWSLIDHSPLTVLGEDASGTVTSVLSLIADRHMLIASQENGFIKVWRNEMFTKSMQMHKGAVFAIAKEGKWLFSGGWDKTVNIQELSGDEFQVDVRPIGSIPCDSVVTALLCWQGKCFVGYANKLVKHIIPKYLYSGRVECCNDEGMFNSNEDTVDIKVSL
ncbi:hypothetical protein FNV43_RR12214 [Rhamnella rubrinervis]|uniref:Uncharacterized protein n=1 Tax=Rhamnella rubrinervis TaxID=2594499 RepID=A0A8K0MI25_9ROSA|nr:hypothetical protein FNV43_RR12214 [Rhamnella rubrinervis]